MDADWVSSWLNYVKGDIKYGRPGPINNEKIKKILVLEETPEGEQEKLIPQTKNNGQPNFYNVSKSLFLFFYQVYGGGPAVVDYPKYKKIELLEGERLHPSLLLGNGL